MLLGKLCGQRQCDQEKDDKPTRVEVNRDAKDSTDSKAKHAGRADGAVRSIPTCDLFHKRQREPEGAQRSVSVITSEYV